MKRKTLFASTLLAAAVGIATVALAHAPTSGTDRGGHMMQGSPPGADQPMMPGSDQHMKGGMMDQMMRHMMGQKNMMGSGMMMGRGMMMGSGMTGSNTGFRREKPLSNDDVRRAVDGKLALSGLSRLKAGTVKDDGENAVNVEVVTPKGEMIFRVKIDRATGRTVIVE